jgi:hypothetical protein
VLKPEKRGTKEENTEVWKIASKHEKHAHHNAGSKEQYIEKIGKRMKRLEEEHRVLAIASPTSPYKSIEDLQKEDARNKAAYMIKCAVRTAKAAMDQAAAWAMLAEGVAEVAKALGGDNSMQDGTANLEAASAANREAEFAAMTKVKDEKIKELEARLGSIDTGAKRITDLEAALKAKEAECDAAIQRKSGAEKEASEAKANEATFEAQKAALHAHYSTVLATNASEYESSIQANSNLVRVYTEHVKSHLKSRVAKHTAEMKEKESQLAALQSAKISNQEGEEHPV